MDNGHEAATKQDVVDAVKASEERVVETMRDIQTEMLKAFYSFAETNQKRLTEAEREAAALKDRLATVESRLMEVEKRLNMPPAA
jgi:division protein CdvB (Snf7/Vps24/ESCRT-III family)